MSYNKEKQFELLKKEGKKGLLADHYELEERFPTYDSDDWRKLLQDPEVSLYIAQEFSMIREAEVRKLQAMASDASRSVGVAQMINAMSSIAEKASNKKEGPTFVYCFVPPSAEQLKAENIRIVDYDLAIKKGLKPKEEPILLDDVPLGVKEEDKKLWKE